MILSEHLNNFEQGLINEKKTTDNFDKSNPVYKSLVEHTGKVNTKLCKTSLDKTALYEFALKEALQNEYPDKHWSEITGCDIRATLLESGNDVDKTARRIVESLKVKQEKETVKKETGVLKENMRKKSLKEAQGNNLFKYLIYNIEDSIKHGGKPEKVVKEWCKKAGIAEDGKVGKYLHNRFVLGGNGFDESLKESKDREVDRRAFASLIKYGVRDPKGNYAILNDGNFVKAFWADSDEEAKEIFSKWSSRKSDESLKESAEWKYTLSCSDDLESAIDSGDLEEVVEALKGAYDELVDQELLDEGRRDKVVSALEQIDVYDDGAESKIEKKLDQFYNVCDKLGVKISFNESLKEGLLTEGKIQIPVVGASNMDKVKKALKDLYEEVKGLTDKVNGKLKGVDEKKIDKVKAFCDKKVRNKYYEIITESLSSYPISRKLMLKYLGEGLKSANSVKSFREFFESIKRKFYNLANNVNLDSISRYDGSGEKDMLNNTSRLKQNAGDTGAKNAIDKYFAKALGFDMDESLKEDVSKKEVIDAIIANHGCSKKEAEKQFKEMSDERKELLVQGFKENAKKSFLTDSLEEGLSDNMSPKAYANYKKMIRDDGDIRSLAYVLRYNNINPWFDKEAFNDLFENPENYLGENGWDISLWYNYLEGTPEGDEFYKKEKRWLPDRITSRVEGTPIKEDTVKQGSSWVNKGKEGTHGKFKTKKGADAQRKAMFANGYKEGLTEGRFDYRTYPLYEYEFTDGLFVIAPDEEEAVAKHDDIIQNMHKGSPRSKEELDKIANDLYDNSDQHSFNYFSDEELAILWSMCMTTPDNHWGRSYDDEVYEAMSNRATKKDILELANKYLDNPKKGDGKSVAPWLLKEYEEMKNLEISKQGEILEESCKSRRKGRKLKESEEGLKPWRGCKNIKFKWNGTQSDPDLIYKGYTFNYYDIEDALWDMFLEDNGLTEKEVYDGYNVKPEFEAQFDQYVCDMAPDYLEDVIAGGYFEGDSKSWHDRYNESKSSRKGKKLTEAPIYDLTPQYDSRQSFYSKAKVDTGDKGDKNRLYSYNTLVAEIKDGKPVVYGTYSATTLRHIKDWLRQNGFKAESAKQIMADYGTKDESLKEGKKINIYKNGDYAYSTNKFSRVKDAVADARKSGKVKVASIPDKEVEFSDEDKVTGKFVRESCKANKGKKSLKEADDSIHIFVQEPPEDDWRDFEFHYGDTIEDLGIVICGNRDFREYGDDTLLQIVKGDYEDEDLWNEEEGYYEDYDVLQELEKVTGKKYEQGTLRGYSQGDWNYIYYPVELEKGTIGSGKHSTIDYIEAFYMSQYETFFDEEDEIEYYVPHFISWEGTGAIKQDLSEQSGVPIEQIKIRKFKGYTRTASYEQDESLKK